MENRTKPLRFVYVCKRYVIAIILVALVTGWIYRHARPSYAKGFSATRTNIVKLLGTSRPCEGRIAGFRYAAVQKGFVRSSRGVLVKAYRGKASISEINYQAASLENLWGEGLLHIAAGRTQDGVKRLEEAVKKYPDIPLLLSDLAAAYIERSARGDPLDLLRAVSFAHKAVAIKSNLIEGKFNLALALEKMKLNEPAQRAWIDYIAHDKSSEWAEESRAHLKRIKSLEVVGERTGVSRLSKVLASNDMEAARHIVRVHPMRSLQVIEDIILAQWAEAQLSRRTSAAGDAVDMLFLLGREIKANSHDSFIFQVATSIESAAPRSRDIIANSYIIYQKAHSLYVEGDYIGASGLFELSAKEYSRGGCPLALRARYYLALCFHHRAAYVVAGQLLSDLRINIDVHYPIMRGQVLWVLGLIEYLSGNPGRSLAMYQSALAYFTKANEFDGSAAIHNLLSEAFDLLGQVDRAWMHRLMALKGISRGADPLNQRNILIVAAVSALQLGYPEAALYFQDASVQAADRARDARALAEALIWRGRINSRLKRGKVAASDFVRARELILKISDEDARRYTAANTAVAMAENMLDESPREAAKLLNEALSYYEERGIRHSHVHYLLSKLSRLLHEEPRVVEMHLSYAIEDLEKERGSIAEIDYRATYFDQAPAVFDEMVRFQFEDKGRPDLAFMYAERGKARATLDALLRKSPREGRNRWGSPFAIETIQGQLPIGMTVVEYRFFQGGLIAFVLERNKFEAISLPLGSAHIEDLIESLRVSSGSGTLDNFRRSSSAIYDIFIRPVIDAVDSSTSEIVFVLDGPLQAVPPAILWDKVRKLYLIERYSIISAPSVSIYLQGLNSKRFEINASKRGFRIALIANPSFNRNLFPKLSPLWDAEGEAENIAPLYGDADIVTGKEATKSKFLALGSSVDVLHVAAHTHFVERNPLLAGLLLAPEWGDDSGILYARELYDRDFSSVRLLILAGCSTGNGSRGKSEGTYSLARGFLTSGVPLVLASMWDISDRDAKVFLYEFHKEFEGKSAAAALRNVQIRFLRDGRRADMWGAFQIIGGGGL